MVVGSCAQLLTATLVKRLLLSPHRKCGAGKQSSTATQFEAGSNNPSAKPCLYRLRSLVFLGRSSACNCIKCHLSPNRSPLSLLCATTFTSGAVTLLHIPALLGQWLNLPAWTPRSPTRESYNLCAPVFCFFLCGALHGLGARAW